MKLFFVFIFLFSFCLYAQQTPEIILKMADQGIVIEENKNFGRKPNFVIKNNSSLDAFYKMTNMKGETLLFFTVKKNATQVISWQDKMKEGVRIYPLSPASQEVVFR